MILFVAQTEERISRPLKIIKESGVAMSYPKCKKNKGKKIFPIMPGRYPGEIVEICNAPGYKPGHAFKLVYRVTMKNGEVKIFEEIFINSDNNPRSAEFFEKMESYGVDTFDLENLVGLKEMLTFEKVTSNFGVPFINIVERERMEEEEK